MSTLPCLKATMPCCAELTGVGMAPNAFATVQGIVNRGSTRSLVVAEPAAIPIFSTPMKVLSLLKLSCRIASSMFDIRIKR